MTLLLSIACSYSSAFALGSLQIDLSPFGVELSGNGDGSATIKTPTGNLINGAYNSNTVKSDTTDSSGNVDKVITTTANKLFKIIKRISGLLLAIGIIFLTGGTVVYLIKLGGSSDNGIERAKALDALKYLAISLAILGSVYTIFGYLISILK